MEDESLIEAHCSIIERNIKVSRGFQTFQKIAGEVMKAEWGKVDCVAPALEKLIARRQIEVDDKHGYCQFGYKNRLLEAMTKPNLPRALFDQLSPSAKLEFCHGGGIVV